MPSKDHDLALYQLLFNSLTGSIHIIHYMLCCAISHMVIVGSTYFLHYAQIIATSVLFTPKGWFSSKGISPPKKKQIPLP